jgi:ABC-type spermidine/putrescine transport system permease subunit I
MSLIDRLRFDPRVRLWALALPGATFVLVFLVLPLASIVVFSFWRTESYEMIAQWNLDNYRVILTDTTYLTFLWRSLVMAFVVSLLCLLYDWPCAYLIAKHGGRYRLIFVLLVAAPFLTGILLRITAMQQILGPIGLLNMALMTFGLQPVQALMYTNTASAIGLIYLWIPFMLVAIYLSLLNFDFQLLEVAKVCGAKPWRAFVEITWPLSSPVLPDPPPILQEYPVPTGSRPHDVAPAVDGGVWYTAQGSGELGWLDPATGKTRHIALGPGSAPHGVIVGPDGAPWITDSGLNAIVRVDPATAEVQLFPLPAETGNANLNTAAFDAQGVLWFTGLRGFYGRLDPATGRMEVFIAPRGPGPFATERCPAPGSTGQRRSRSRSTRYAEFRSAPAAMP